MNVMLRFLVPRFMVKMSAICLAATWAATGAVAQDAPNAAPTKLGSMALADVQPLVYDELSSRLGSGPLDAIWNRLDPQASAEALQQATVASLALADPQAADVLAAIRQGRQGLTAPELAWLTEQSSFCAAQLRVAVAQWLVQEQFFEEALPLLANLEVEQVIDPAALLFYRGVAEQRLVQRDAALADLERLLDEVETCPPRWRAVAELMQADLATLKDDTLDLVSRQMEDVRRRLDFGRGGPRTQEAEARVLAGLDKLIDELEQQRKQQQSSSQSGGMGQGSNRPSGQPANDSRILGGRGEGDVTQRDIGSRSGWGDLPPKARQEALQQIGRDFPAHYRHVVEQYFRKLAGHDESPAAP